MKDEVIQYKCPSCGGIVSFQGDKCICEYCGKESDSPVKSESIKNNLNINSKSIKAYSYTCDNCGITVISEDKNNLKCTKCNTVVGDKISSITLANIINSDIDEKTAKDNYNNNIRPFIWSLEDEFIDDDLISSYVFCDLYNGIVSLKYKSKTNKFVFVNLIVPNLDFEDYRLMYEISNNGLASYKKTSSKKNNNACVVLKSKKNDGKKIIKEEELVNACIDVFAKKNHISKKEDIQINKKLNVSSNLLIPVYYREIKTEDNTYRMFQFAIGNKKNKDSSYFEFPNNNKRSKTRVLLYKILSRLSLIMAILSVINVLYLYGVTIASNKFADCYTPLIYGFIFAILNYLFDKKYKYYKNTLVYDKKMYLSKIVDNSQYVKVIKGINW